VAVSDYFRKVPSRARDTQLVSWLADESSLTQKRSERQWPLERERERERDAEWLLGSVFIFVKTVEPVLKSIWGRILSQNYIPLISQKLQGTAMSYRVNKGKLMFIFLGGQFFHCFTKQNDSLCITWKNVLFRPFKWYHVTNICEQQCLQVGSGPWQCVSLLKLFPSLYYLLYFICYVFSLLLFLLKKVKKIKGQICKLEHSNKISIFTSQYWLTKFVW